MTASSRHTSRAVLAVLAVLGLGWSAILLVAGGVDTSIFGVTVTSNDPARPAIAGGLAALAYAWLDRRRLSAWYARLEVALSAINDDLRRMSSRSVDSVAALAAVLRPARLAGALALTTGIVATVLGSTSGTGADAYGYVSQADLWLEGDLRIEQPWVNRVPWPDPDWTFSPLGYRPVGEGDALAIVPTYSPGLPILMAAANAVAGHAAMFLLVPLSGVLLVIGTYRLGALLVSPVVGLVAALIAITSPPVLMHLMLPMTDVPVAAAWCLSAVFLLGRSRASAVGAGASTALALLIRPNLVFLAAIYGLWFVLEAIRDRTWREPAVRAALYSVAVAPGAIAVALINQTLYGSATTSGYGDVGGMFSASHIWPNLGLYLGWMAETATPLTFIGLVAVFVPLRAVWPAGRARWFLVIAAASTIALFAFYCMYLVFETWSYLRFLLSVWPFLAVGAAASLAALTRLKSRAVRAAAIAAGLAIVGFQFSFAVHKGVFGFGESERHYPGVALSVRDVTPPGSVVLAMQHSGSVRYYGGRQTLRYDYLSPDWLERAVAWMDEQGAPVYLLLQDWEVDEFARRFAGRPLAESLSSRAVLIYAGSSRLTLYRLSGPEPTIDPVEVVPDVAALRNVLPAPDRNQPPWR